MSVMNLVTNRNKPLLDVPWETMTKSWNEQSLREARKHVLSWEQLYPDPRRRIRHNDCEKCPLVPSFDEIDRSLIAPMVTLGGIKFFSNTVCNVNF